jgi:hypothetical protein
VQNIEQKQQKMYSRVQQLRLPFRYEQVKQGKLAKRPTRGSCGRLFAVTLYTTFALLVAIQHLFHLTNDYSRVSHDEKRLFILNRAAFDAVIAQLRI